MIVEKYFIDKTDKTEYNPGDVYPREGLEADDARIADLTAKGYISGDPEEKPEEDPKDGPEEGPEEGPKEDPEEEQKPTKKTASSKKKKGVTP